MRTVKVKIHFQWKKDQVTDWGDLHIPSQFDMVPGDVLEHVFRRQNRVLEDDVLIFDDFPSLTAGDMVALQMPGKEVAYYYCDSFGWREMSSEERDRWLALEDSFDRSPFGFNRKGEKVSKSDNH